MSMSGTFLTTVIVLAAGTENHAAALDLAQWQYCAKVTTEEGTDAYCRLTLTPDVYNVARSDLGDIRLINAAGEQMPYVLAEPRDITGRQTYAPTVINRSTNADRAAMLTLDFGDKTTKNAVEVVSKGSNFRRAVKVEGSNDNVEFFTLIEQAFVFAVSGDRRFELVDLPPNDYRYLRISVSPMPSEQTSPLIEAVRAFRTEHARTEHQPAKMLPVEHREDDKNGSSLYVYDLAYRSLPLSEIEFDIADDAFYRYITVDGRDAATRNVLIDSEDSRQRFREIEVSWERIVSDAIYRYAAADGRKHEKLVLRIPSGRRVPRYLRVEIRNYDDKPLLVKSASANTIAHEIVFECKDNAASLLYVGSESAGMPRYDLGQRLSDPLGMSARRASLEGITANPLFKPMQERPPAWTETHRGLLLTVLVAVAVVLGVFMLKSFKSIQSQQAQNR